MYSGVYIGQGAKAVKERVLILGESHYSKDESVDFSTADVLVNFHRYPCEKKYAFFHRIAKSFNINEDNIDDEFVEFWNKVYFGNYIEELCEIKTNRAKDLIKNNHGKNRYTYNDNLFRYINDNNISYVFVFSRLVFNEALPSLSKNNIKDEKLPNLDNGELKVGQKKDYICKCKFLANTEHKYVNVILNHDVIFYGLRHPSSAGGYNVSNYNNVLGPIFINLIK